MSAYCIGLMCLQFGLGVSHANPQDSGIWYMQGPQYPHTLALNSPNGLIGVQSESFRIGIEYLGRFEANAAAVATNDPSKVACAPGCFPISSQWHGTGRVMGLYATGVARSGPWYVEGGPFLYRATWNEHVDDWRNPSIAGYPVQPVNISSDRTSLGALIGAGYRAGRLEYGIGIHLCPDRGNEPSIVKGYVTDLTIRWTFK